MGTIRAVKSGITVGLSVLVLFTAAVSMAAAATQPPAPFYIYGWVFDTANQPLPGPTVTVKNLNTTESYAVETNASSNYYQVITASCNVSVGDMLNFNASDDGNTTSFNLTVTAQNMTDGGLFEQDIMVGVKPDLVISDVWVCWPDNCTICYNITNIGNGPAPSGHNTTLYVDGNETAYDIVPVTLAPGESAIRCFNYTWKYTPDRDNITVCADNKESIEELNEDNNCLTEIWMCGDVNGDLSVDVIDVTGLFYHRIKNLWAADVNCDGSIDVIDVTDLFYHRLNCCCQG